MEMPYLFPFFIPSLNAKAFAMNHDIIFEGLDTTYQRLQAALCTALNKHWQDLRGKKGKEGTHCLPLQTTSGRLGGNVTIFVDKAFP